MSEGGHPEVAREEGAPCPLQAAATLHQPCRPGLTQVRCSRDVSWQFMICCPFCVIYSVICLRVRTPSEVRLCCLRLAMPSRRRAHLTAMALVVLCSGIGVVSPVELAVQPHYPDAHCGERVAAPVTGAQERAMWLVAGAWPWGLGRGAVLGESIRWTGTGSLGLGRSLWCALWWRPPADSGGCLEMEGQWVAAALRSDALGSPSHGLRSAVA